jgi:pimeloyl-ACP methyl ester carboxylesterase
MTNGTITMTDGRTVGFADYGSPSQTAVVWCHGGPGSRLEPSFVAESAARAGIRLIGIDRPGYGLSTAQPGRTIGGWVPDALAVLDHLGIEQFFTLGVSTGGAYALALASRSSRVLGALACCAVTDMRWVQGKAMNASCHPVWSARDRDEACAIARELFGEHGENVLPRPAVLDAFDAALFATPETLAWWIPYVSDMFTSGVAGFADDRLADRDGWGTFDVTRISCPVTVLHGVSDGLMPVANAYHTAAIVPGATLRILEGVGHISIVTRTVEVMSELIDTANQRRREMSYNPFVRGPYPVGVRTVTAVDDTRDGRALTIEIWYPATQQYRGQDLDDVTRDLVDFAPELPPYRQSAVRDAAIAPGQFPLLLHTHGAFGYRQVMSGLCTHLASHGYIVASNDVPGNTLTDLMNDVIGQRRGEAPRAASQQSVSRLRCPDARFAIDALLGGTDPVIADRIDRTRIGSLGQSAGGWTSLGLNSIDRRIGATFAMEPLYGVRSPAPVIAEISAWLSVEDWGRPVPTLLLAGEVDPLVILDDLRDLYARLQAPKRFANVKRAGHWHFADNAEVAHETFRKMYLAAFPDPTMDTQALGEAMRPWSELLTEDKAADTARSLCLAHMDAHLKGNADAMAFLDRDLVGTFAHRGIDIEVAAHEREAVLA